MAEMKMIVSSKRLHELLLSLPLDQPVVFTRHDPAKEYFSIAGEHMGICNKRFEDFSVPNLQARYLAHVVRQLLEQPITLVWDGEHFSFTDFVI